MLDIFIVGCCNQVDPKRAGQVSHSYMHSPLLRTQENKEPVSIFLEFIFVSLFISLWS